MMRLPYLIRTLINFNTGFNRLCEFLNSQQHRIHRSTADRWALQADKRHRPAPAKPVLEGDQSRHRAGELVGDHRCHRAGKSCLLHLVAGFDNGFEGQHPSPRAGSPIWATSPG